MALWVPGPVTAAMMNTNIEYRLVALEGIPASIRYVTASLNISSGSNFGLNTAVPLGRTYSTPPRVQATINGHTFAHVTVDGPATTTTTCSVRVFRPDGSNAASTTPIPVLLQVVDVSVITG